MKEQLVQPVLVLHLSHGRTVANCWMDRQLTTWHRHCSHCVRYGYDTPEIAWSVSLFWLFLFQWSSWNYLSDTDMALLHSSSCVRSQTFGNF